MNQLELVRLPYLKH